MKREKLLKKPVKWLLGKQLISGIRWIAVYALYGEKLDARDWMRAEWIEDDKTQDFLKAWQQKKEDVFWFDYFADTGDGQQSTYNMAYLVMSDLWLENETAQPGSNSVSLDKNNVKLPRGEFLFVGGDTAYHIADFSTLTERFQKPFNYAYDDLFGDEVISENKKAIFAIPGNHDYYDALDGFHRQFCKPIEFPANHPHASISKYSAQLELKGFNRCQQASYVALKLPFDWMFWGLDCQEGHLDTRQQAFFLSTSSTEAGQLKIPDKLIVATPEPTTKFGLWADEDAEITRTFNEKLWIEPCFLKKNNGSLDASKCRLDISGDIHHYERYWGQSQDQKSTTPNYASVVSGGGGAFLHATHTDLGEVETTQSYPTKEDSYHLMMKKLLNPKNIFEGGYVWLAGGVLIMVTYFALSIPDSSWAVFSRFSEFQLIPNSIRPCGAEYHCNDSLLNRIQQMLSVNDIQTQSYDFHFADLSYIIYLLGLVIYMMTWVKDKKHKKSVIQATKNQWKAYRLNFTLLFFLSMIPTPLLIFLSKYDNNSLFPIAGSLLALLFLVVATMMLILARQLADILTERKKFTELQEHNKLHFSWYEQELPSWLLIMAAIVTACFGSWRYGVNSAAIALTDTISLTFILLGFVGLIALAWFSGASLLADKAKQHFLVIGTFHAIVQFSVALSLVIFADWLGIFLIITFLTLATLFTPKLPLFNIGDGQLSSEKQEEKAKQLFYIWLAIGITTLLLTLFLYGEEPKEITWLRIFTAFIIGSILSCIWFGWYLAVSLGFNGHNNEAGGGARTASYRHFIRFKLTENQLTGYVIGVDNPDIDFTKDRTFRLVDIFTVNAIKK
ncbi:MAG: hypothetical protein L3J59_02110 [Methylococcaceae bacterium]|nr:hypothetical protein [Methylococcaceae bacterium]